MIKSDLKLFREIINKTSDAIFIAESETGRIIDVNEKACTSTGYSREDLLNMHVMDVDAVTIESSLWKEDVKEFRKKGNMMFQSVHKRKDGTTFPVEINMSYYPLDGRNGFIIGFARDITERKQAEEVLHDSENRLKAIFDTAPECIKILDAQANLIMMNRAGLEMLQVKSLDQVKDRYVCPIITSEYRPAFMDLLKRVFQRRIRDTRVRNCGYEREALVA